MPVEAVYIDLAYQNATPLSKFENYCYYINTLFYLKLICTRILMQQHLF